MTGNAPRRRGDERARRRNLSCVLYVSNASRQTSTEVDNFSLPVVAVISEDVAQVAVQL